MMNSSQNTRKKVAFMISLGLFISLWIPLFNVFADTGSNPRMGFYFEYNVDSVTMEDAKLMLCDDPVCTSSQEVLGPFHCDIDYCSYGYAGNESYKLVIVFSDKTRESNVFQKTSHETKYTVMVEQDGMVVSEQPMELPYEPRNQAATFLIALAITIPIEMVVAGIFLKIIKQTNKPLIILFANLITLPLLWFVFPLIPLNATTVLLCGEIFAFLFEAWFLHKFFEDMTWKTALLLSLVVNLVSFLLPAVLIFSGYFPGFPLI